MSTSNFKDINTVQDLLNHQKEAESQEQESGVADGIMKQVLAEDPEVGIELAQRIVYALADLHVHGVEQYKEEGDIEAAVLWQADATTLQQALALLKTVVI